MFGKRIFPGRFYGRNNSQQSLDSSVESFESDEGDTYDIYDDDPDDFSYPHLLLRRCCRYTSSYINVNCFINSLEWFIDKARIDMTLTVRCTLNVYF